MSLMKVLVVGGTGRLGSQVAKKLVAAGQEQTKWPRFTLAALSRSERGDAVLRGMSGTIEPRRGDLMNRASLDNALRGVNVVVSSAAGYTKHSKGDTPETDLAGIKNLIDACKTSGIRRLVLLSILESEKAVNVPHFHHKALQERYAEEQGLPFISVRAPVFIDQDDASDMMRSKIPSGVFPAFFDLSARCAWIHTEHVSTALVEAALFLPDEALGKRIPITAQPVANATEIANLLSEILGKKIAARPAFPSFLLWTASLFSARMKDMKAMVDWVNTGAYVTSARDLELQVKYFGAPPSLRDSFALYLRTHNLMK